MIYKLKIDRFLKTFNSSCQMFYKNFKNIKKLSEIRETINPEKILKNFEKFLKLLRKFVEDLTNNIEILDYF